jgi:hypothetical protein
LFSGTVSEKMSWLRDQVSLWKVDELSKLAGAEWTAADIKALLLEVCQQPRPGMVPDMKQSTPGNLKWEEMEAFEEYKPAARSEAEVYGLELGAYLRGRNNVRTALYEYKHHDSHREVFVESTIAALEACNSFEQLLATIPNLATRQQDTA